MANCFNNTTLLITQSDWNSWVNSPKRMVACCLKLSSNKVKKWHSIRCQPHEVCFDLWLPSKQTNKKWNVSVCIVCFNGLVQRQDWTKCLSLHNIVIERTLFCDAVELAYNCDFMFHGSYLCYVDQSCVGGLDAMLYTLLSQWDTDPGTRSVLIRNILKHLFEYQVHSVDT